MASQEGPETTAHRDLRGRAALPETTGTKESAAMMAHRDQMDAPAKREYLERRASKVPVATEVQEETRGIQDPVESRGGRAQLAPTETLVRTADPDLLATEEMKDQLDQKDPKGREESKELRETEARWGPGEKTARQEMELKVVMVSRVILDNVETLVSRVAREPLDPKETTETPENQAPTTMNQDVQDLKGPKVTEEPRANRDLLDHPDQQEVMNVKFWISS